MNDLGEREDIYYKKFSDLPFTGDVEGLVQGSFKDGLTEGLWVESHDDGSAQLEHTGIFKNGVKIGD